MSALTGGYQLAFIVGAALVGVALVVAVTVLQPERKAQARATRVARKLASEAA